MPFSGLRKVILSVSDLKGSNNGISQLGFLFLAFIYHILKNEYNILGTVSYHPGQRVSSDIALVILIGRCLPLLPKDRTR